MERYLYRGVNAKIHEDTGGKLEPKAIGEPFKRLVKYGHFKYGEVTYGKSLKNAVVSHQKNSSAYPTSGISTTPFFDKAKVYATNKGKYATGVIYKIDTELLQKAKVRAYKVIDFTVKPALPDDKEIILVAEDFGTLPAEIVVEVIEV
jgi:hypothetical protein